MQRRPIRVLYLTADIMTHARVNDLIASLTIPRQAVIPSQAIPRHVEKADTVIVPIGIRLLMPSGIQQVGKADLSRVSFIIFSKYQTNIQYLSQAGLREKQLEQVKTGIVSRHPTISDQGTHHQQPQSHTTNITTIPQSIQSENNTINNDHRRQTIQRNY